MPLTAKRSKDHYAAKTKRKLVKIKDLRKLQKIQDNVAGIDVGGEFHFVAAPDPKHNGKIVVQRFGSFTTHLCECVDWLKELKIKSVAMEATGVYWMTLYTMLEEKGIEVVLVNARDLKKMKDKKTDIYDAEYLQLYHSYGLLEGAFIPEKKICELRTYVRSRDQFVREAARGIQRMKKSLIQMNLRLDNVLSDISGETGMSIIYAILGGERNPKTLAEYRDPRCRKTEKEIEDSLRGFYQECHLFTLECAVKEYEFYKCQIDQCDMKIQQRLSEFATIETSKEVLANTKTLTRKKSKRSKRSYEFSFDLKKELIRITGKDLTVIAGLGESMVLSLISETGLNMKRWKSSKHFKSWLRIAANNKISGGKVLHKRTQRGSTRGGILFRMAASSLYHESNDTAIGAFFRRKKAHIGSPKAITAAGCKIAQMYYLSLSSDKPFVEPGAKAYLEMQKTKYLRRVRRTVSQWGYDLVKKEAC